MQTAIDFTSAEVCILETLHDGEFAEIFLTSVDSLICIMKVYHDDTDDGELEALGIKPTPTLFDMEKAAYQRLMERGLCDTGVVPGYYGSLEKLDLKRWDRNLAAFSNDKYPPNAIFLEYIPNMRMLDLETYSESRMSAFIYGLRLIHKAHILHRDVRPRNMMIVSEPYERIIWMDFDRARTYNLDHLAVEEKVLFAREMEGLEQMGPLLAEDQIKGKIDATGVYFYT